MNDYLWNFPTTGLALALQGLDALRAELSLPPNAMPGNALGDPRDAEGNVVIVPSSDEPREDSVVWVGRPGTAAKGDPDRYYMHIRTADDLSAVAFDPSQYGMVVTGRAESAAVLGVWAGDDVSDL